MKRFFIFPVIVLLFSCNPPAGPVAPDIHLADSRFMLQQRSTRIVGESEPNVLVGISDITGGMTQVKVMSNDMFTEMYLDRSMRVGETSDFVFKGKSYRLTVLQLINHLVDEDYAEISITGIQTATADSLHAGMGDTPATDDLISGVLDSVSRSGLVFLRNGEKHSSADAAEHLRSKWNHARKEIKTWDDFVRQVVSVSSMTGRPYEIINEKGETVLLKDWIETIRKD